LKKKFLALLIVLAITIAMVPSTAYAASKTATLDSFIFVEGKGWVAVFIVSENWTEADLKDAFITVDGKIFPLYCNFRDDGRVACSGPSLLPYIGKLAYLTLGGQGFSATVPSTPTPYLFPYQCAHGVSYSLEMTVITTEILGSVSLNDLTGEHSVFHGYKYVKRMILSDPNIISPRFIVDSVICYP
jgi:hypothetical protein